MSVVAHTQTYEFTAVDGLDITGTTNLRKDGSMLIELSIHGGAGKITVEYTDDKQVTTDTEALIVGLREAMDELLSTAYTKYVTHFINELFK